jgi:hypothetical protein
LKKAEELLKQAAQLRSEARESVDEAFGLASDEAIGTLQAFKPPR